MVASCNVEFDWAKEIKEFDETKAGVKGLVDAGVKEIPRLFVHPQEVLERHPTAKDVAVELPVIDLSGAERGGARRREVVEAISKAAREWGFFSIVKHGIPLETMDAMLECIKIFHELPKEEKIPLYTTERNKPVKWNSNLPAQQNDPACWRDVLNIVYTDDHLEAEEIPSACRKELEEYVKYMIQVRELMAELISEALGLPADYLSKMECMKSQSLSCLYYPACPEPHKTLGAPKHSDTTFLTLLIQDRLGGLQMLRHNQWLDVPPVRGALIANFGDLMQILSNDEFISVEHRVLSQSVGPRISVATFSTPSIRAAGKPFGPIKELLSQDKPAVYRDFMFEDYFQYYKTKGARVESAFDYYRINK
ncbi:1-aminocyclopropane-1-carboxylate oxidase homolog 12-like [Salvia miltiorrhiza]|uniref:1-aminocyclopropane-1-carboxylate oxidase homolog 12-like n=1 Tax=Salvia miltiorrhiza TaxID=226208 RepID=UPI0025AC57DE|nr:1-aminocyclopropane-1-carboxylate oxidase homolog 12-like [Salvia miltiorrhiza]